MIPLFVSVSSKEGIDALLSSHTGLQSNLSREELIAKCVGRKEAFIAQSGALAVWNPAHSTGRIPKDTYMVEHAESKGTIDWSAEACIPMQPALFDMLLKDALAVLATKEEAFELDRVIGADSAYALPTKLLTDSAVSTLFADTMFRAIPQDLERSIFADEEFTIVALPHDRIDTSKYEGVLRSVNGKTVDMLLAMDFDRKIGIIYGSSYCGCIKKMMFTVLNQLLPEHGILPLHCSANESADGEVALFLGLSGTGKTTISNVPDRKLIGDDEHGWSDSGIANFENGCYAKLINLDPAKEPQIYEAVFKKRPFLEHGSIVENALMYPDGTFDLSDSRLTENSRVSYPLSAISNVKEGHCGGHPSTIIFLTADATGVLPPIAKLSSAEAMLWFLMGYTSKLAGTELGITEPKAAFSRFFGAPFMPRLPEDYASLLGTKMKKHDCQVYLVNTGWTGGPYGVGKRFDIRLTRAVVDAALSGVLRDVEYERDERFHLSIPVLCPGVDSVLLKPKSTWADAQAYESAADALAAQFALAFEKSYGNAHLDPAVRSACPGL
ncbi:phosphoenolpyruvate carboxykinase (ATP) [Candidatus Peregrinibacteria bacterium CG10_big_fil_rev_8_21_14_0_10_49_24]|nr:MAG: phosphoenolpyruvate carboxykinase (ATP) [Candidatus Peregrinibacteria bacterium CG11_big_fil_rev_8_21_14_0_20_49_14]PIR51194.1 MAG: phosphoenolpyruvate carboxykinase (ATP) [Candidatus Peregrinibacteria bacterium CG10_big_fil_rev_8_21_14_0_10_49_24]PJA67233.1 MAG: phosphoenolpyruvate carboxykinase (ATP) [Candidatus Peregrinibacteria bacterium CG_4_9_14_3_um_filter_49_12]